MKVVRKHLGNVANHFICRARPLLQPPPWLGGYGYRDRAIAGEAVYTIWHGIEGYRRSTLWLYDHSQADHSGIGG